MKRLFVDMDGTLAFFHPVTALEQLYEEGYFRNLEPHENVLQGIKGILQDHADQVEVYILSAYLSDSAYALAEKEAWLDQYLPELPEANRIFMPCGAEKMAFVPEGIREDDYLLDDYTKNLSAWEPPAKGIKLLNGINGTKGTWQSERISYERDGKEIAEAIVKSMMGQQPVYDKLPKVREEIDRSVSSTDIQPRTEEKVVREGLHL